MSIGQVEILPDYHLEWCMVQQKINKIFKEIPNAFGTAADILIVGYDADDIDHNRPLRHVMQICNKGNVKLNNK